MLPPPISQPFKTTSYWVVRISPMFFWVIRSSIYFGFGAEKGLWVNVHFFAPSELRSAGISSKKGKSITQQNARRFGSFLSFRRSGLSVLYFSIASLYEILGNGVSCIFFSGYDELTRSIRSFSFVSITSSLSTKLISRSS